jgi:hypothetical protein
MTDTNREQPSDDPYFHVIRCRFGGPIELLAEWNEWYDNVHVPAILAVPGIRSFTRYGQLRSERDFLTVWQIDGPHIFDEPAYAAVRGFGAWEEHMQAWTISLLTNARPARRFGSAMPTDVPL